MAVLRWRGALCCTVPYCTVLYCTVLLCGAVAMSAVQCSAVQCCAVYSNYCTVVCGAVARNVVLSIAVTARGRFGEGQRGNFVELVACALALP